MGSADQRNVVGAVELLDTGLAEEVARTARRH